MQLLSKLLLQWELDPPTLSASEFLGQSGEVLKAMKRRGLLCQAMQSGVARCDECGESQAVTFLPDRVKESDVGYITCTSCGPTRLGVDDLNRNTIDTTAMLRHLFANIRLAIRPVVADRLWQLGRLTLDSRSRECWFVRGLADTKQTEIQMHLTNHPKTILFTPSDAMASTWSLSIANSIISVESVIDHDESNLWIDVDALHSRIRESDVASVRSPKPRPKRASRTAKIERLINELKKHLRSAADHARATDDHDDGPALLPRPTQEQLGRIAGMSKVDVTRCMNDESANELRLLWQTANDLTAILRLRSKTIR